MFPVINSSGLNDDRIKKVGIHDKYQLIIIIVNYSDKEIIAGKQSR